MAVLDLASPSQPVSPFMEAIRRSPWVEGLWVLPKRDRLEYWLLTRPITPEVERGLYGISGLLYEEYAPEHMDFHLINPLALENVNPRELIPLRAQQIRLH